MRSEAFGKVASTPSNSARNFFPIFDPATWTEVFRGFSRPEVVRRTCFSRRSAIFILMPALPFQLGDLCRWCPELHRQPRPTPHFHSRCRRLTYCKTAANQKGIQPQF